MLQQHLTLQFAPYKAYLHRLGYRQKVSSHVTVRQSVVLHGSCAQIDATTMLDFHCLSVSTQLDTLAACSAIQRAYGNI